jgi:hypothetical protein
MANPAWAINLLDRSETVIDFLKRSGVSSASISNLSGRIRKGLISPSEELPAGEMYHSMHHCLISNFVDGCAIGGGMSVLVSVLPQLLKGHVRQAIINIPTLGNLRVAVFFGALLSVCNTGQYVHAGYIKRSGSVGEEAIRSRKRIRLFIGLLSGLSIGVLPTSIRRFIVYLLITRSFEVLARIIKMRILYRRWQQRRSGGFASFSTTCSASIDEDSTLQENSEFIPPDVEMFSSHEVVGLGCCAMTVIITGWFQYPHLVPKAYLQFLQGINNLTPENVTSIKRVLSLTDNCSDSPFLCRIKAGEDPFCRCIHDGSSTCPDFFIKFLIKGFFTRTAPFYLKLYMLPLTISVIKRRGKASEFLVTHFMQKVVRSAVFLTTMNAAVAGSACFLGKHFYSVSSQRAQLTLAGTICGLSLYIEEQSRRLELSLYLFGQAIQILVNGYVNAGLWAPRGVDIIASAASISLLLYAYWESAEDERFRLIRPGYANLLKRIIDTKDYRHGFHIIK